MSVEEAIAAHKLDEYKEQTGDYSATKKPELSDFISSHVEDYEGEWLHVNDHGNCTLYVRDDKGEDVEIWAIV